VLIVAIMVKYRYTTIVFGLFKSKLLWSTKKIIASVAFFIISNFDTNDPATNDDEWTPKELNIGHQKIPSKLENLSRVLLEIGSAENTNSQHL
jgi:hypothetical protein